MAKRGIDISSHQGDIDLEALRHDIDFVIIRVGFGTKGTLDTKFKRNADLCKELGIPVGFYWYSYALDVPGAAKEAEAFLKAIEPYNPEYGCWFDMEDADGYKKKKGMPSNEVLQNMCYTFCEVVEYAGYPAGIYASESWFKKQLSNPSLNRFEKWVAQWPTSKGKQKGLSVSPDSKTGVAMWQFTSEGRFEGYSGRLDVNYAYKEFNAPKSNMPEIKPEHQKFSIGEKVIVNGDLYVSANDTASVGRVTDKATAITRYVAGTLHPYNTTGDLGWMDEDSIKKNVTAGIKKRGRVMFTGNKTYSGLTLADWVTGATFDVIEVSGDRVVIGKGTSVTAAVNAKDCIPL